MPFYNPRFGRKRIVRATFHAIPYSQQETPLALNLRLENCLPLGSMCLLHSAKFLGIVARLARWILDRHKCLDYLGLFKVIWLIFPIENPP